MSKNTLEDRIAELEMRLAFQDDVINTLSEQVARQEMDIRELWDAKKTLHKQLKDISPSNIRPEGQGVPRQRYCFPSWPPALGVAPPDCHFLATESTEGHGKKRFSATVADGKVISISWFSSVWFRGEKKITPAVPPISAH